MTSAAETAYDLFYQISPVTLTGGLAGNVTGALLPIVATLGGLGGLSQGLLSGISSGAGVSLSDFPWRFMPVSGAQAVYQTAALYPFANRQIAANATVEQPKTFALKMIWPVNQTGGMLTKTALFSSLKATLESHNANGGTYTVAMPAMFMTNCLLLSLSDITPDDSRQKQVIWQWDFFQPLLSQAQAAGALSGLMRILDGGGVATSSSWSGIEPAIGSGVQTGINAVSTGVQGVASDIGNWVGSVL